MTDLIIVAILAVIVGAAARYVYKAKKSGTKCIGCSVGDGACCCSHGQTETSDCGCNSEKSSCCCCHSES